VVKLSYFSLPPSTMEVQFSGPRRRFKRLVIARLKKMLKRRLFNTKKRRINYVERPRRLRRLAC
jgi:hypothetical protein